MSGVVNFLGGIAGAIFGGGGGGGQQTPMMPPTPTPAPIPPAPDRSDADIQASANRARAAYGTAGGRVNNALTGGIGVPNSATYGAITQLLGGVGR